MVGIRELRADLAAQVRRAGSGQRVIITIDGRSAAQLGPIEPEHGLNVLADLIAAGAVHAPCRAGAIRPRPAVPVWSGVRIDRALREVRG